MKLCMGQINTLVGDWEGNAEQILTVCRDAAEQPPMLLLFFLS